MDFGKISLIITRIALIYCAVMLVVLIVLRIINRFKAKKAIKNAEANPVTEVIHCEDKKTIK